ncbi:hypothetical protein [Agarivorans sp. JK6]|uniref:hypothetical protein n=1 Tax=Agarivorans sp. JK6 TaxID=2997426 RepID=UPI003872D5D0
MKYMHAAFLGLVSILLSACFGVPTKTGTYSEVVGPNKAGCLNGYSVVIDEEKCENFRVGNLFVDMAPRGSKRYYQDPETSPYKLPSVVCTIERGSSYDIQTNFIVEEVVVTTNSGRVFTDFDWGFTSFNQDCKYLFLKPKLDINVERDSELKVKMVASVLTPEKQTKEMNFVFSGVSHWHFPFYGP